jgi:isopentenyl-diphosphate delta-isomerase
MKEQEVILVNEKDEAIGTMEKMEAHREGALHRAFSVFIFDKKGRMLLQQRASEKYHGGHLWSNACCSHPYPEEKTDQAAIRRLEEEMGFITPLKEIFAFTYKSEVENDLIEHEYDHVYAGEYDGVIIANQAEVADYSYEDMEQIRWAIENQPGKFTSWFRIAFPKIEAWWGERYREVTGPIKT